MEHPHPRPCRRGLARPGDTLSPPASSGAAPATTPPDDTALASLRQELTGALKLGLPESVRARARVAHKTGEISTAAHDAGLVFLPDRRPFALVVLSEWPAGSDSRQAALGGVVDAVYRHFVDGAGGQA